MNNNMMADPTQVTIATEDGGSIHADYWQRGGNAVLLVHGKVFDKQSWRSFAELAASKGLTVFVPDLRGYGESVGPDSDEGYAIDVAAGVHFLREKGEASISIIGGSMGAMAAAEAVVSKRVREIEALILLAPRSISEPAKLMANRILFVASEDEDACPAVRAQYDAAPEPKRLLVYPGSAHAQHLFDSPNAGELSKILLETVLEHASVL